MRSKNELRMNIELLRDFSIDLLIKETLRSWPKDNNKIIRKNYQKINKDISEISKIISNQLETMFII